MKNRIYLAVLAVLFTHPALGFFIDGEGQYSLRPFTQTNPGFNGHGLYQGTLQSFGLLGKIRTGDKLTLKMQMRLFDDPRKAFLGDSPEPESCSQVEDGEDRKYNNNRGSSKDGCEGRYQDTSHPSYAGYQPQFTEVYAEYAFDYCLLEAGRRGRDWGMGVFLDSGKKPFATSYSIFDGVTCKINIQKMQPLGFSIGFDKITETGTSIDVNLPRGQDAKYGASKTSDDLDQLFFTIEYDDRKINGPDRFSRQIGIYFSNTIGSSKSGEEAAKAGDKAKRAKTDLKYADLYTGLYYGGFSLRNEVLFRLGKSGDPSWSRYGGISNDTTRDPIKNDLSAIAFAGEIRYKFGQSGSYVGPAEYNQGTYTAHHIFSEYAYAPGDRDGYFEEDVRRDRKSKKVKAVAFHRNYQPAMILFNNNPELDDLRVDGIFDPSRVMNTTLLTLGYRYESLQYGNFETKFISAQLNTSIPDEIKQSIYRQEQNDKDADRQSSDRPIGYSGKHLGYELDLSYSYSFGKGVEIGGAGAAAIPGSAWRIARDETPSLSYLLMGTAAFKF